MDPIILGSMPGHPQASKKLLGSAGVCISSAIVQYPRKRTPFESPGRVQGGFGKCGVAGQFPDMGD